MKTDIWKKIEIVIGVVNLVVFIVVNLLKLRTFHWVAAVIMAAVPVVLIFLKQKKELVLILVPFIVWTFTISVTDKVSTVHASEKYEIALENSNYEFFPDSIPEDAVNREFYHFPGFWLAKSKAYVKFEATKEYLDEYEQLHESAVEKVTSTDVWLERHIESDKICKRINDSYINMGNCDVYIKAEGFSIQGYAINRDINEVFIFYDGFD